jgi:O-antigen/teichoic acid export membrane protein
LESKILKNILIYGIGDFIVTGVSAFLLIPLYVHFLSAEDYGVFNILNNNILIITYIFQIGIISAFGRLYYVRKAINKEDEYISSIIIFHLIYSLFLFLAICIFWRPIFNLISPSIQNKKLLVFPVAMSFLTFLPALYYIYVRVAQRANVFVRLQVLTVFLMLSIIGLILFFSKLTLITLVISLLITNSLIWFIVILLFFKKIHFKIHFIDVKETLEFSLPIFIGYLAYFFISRYSLIVLQNHVTLDKIGVFSLAQQIAMIPTLVSIAIGKALQPYLFESDSDKQLLERSQQMDSLYKIFIIWIVGCLIFSIDIIMRKFLPDHYKSTIRIAQFMLLINMIYNFALVEGSILFYKLKSKIISGITILGSIVNVLLCNWLVVNYNINGVILAMLFAFSLTFSLECYFSRIYIRYRYNIKQILIGITIILTYLILSALGWDVKYSFLMIVYKIIGIMVLTSLLYFSIKAAKSQQIEI